MPTPEDAGLTPPRTTKAALRSALLRRRAALPAAQRAAAAAVIRQRLAGLPEVAGARALLGYAAFGSEVDVDALLAAVVAQGRGLLLPWVVDGERLGVARVRDLDADLVPGAFGIREPRAIGRKPARPDRLDVVLVPGVAFDRSGGRLGYGRGYFDRLLPALRPGTPVIGVAFDIQLVSAVPREPHDRQVDAVVTESAVYRR